MDIYIRSRGFEQNNDYRWLQVTKDNQERVDRLPCLFDKEVFNLIQSEAPSIVIARRNEKLLLLLTGIRPEGRRDFCGRQIRISIAWISENSKDNERVFRMLAVRALEEEEQFFLTQEVSEAVPLEGEYGFQGNFEYLLQLANVEKAKRFILDKKIVTDDQLSKKLAKNSPAIKEMLAEELKQYSLPTQEGILVIVTGIKKEETLKNANVWRGVSSLVASEEGRWKMYEDFNNILEIFKYIDLISGLPNFVSWTKLFGI